MVMKVVIVTAALVMCVGFLDAAKMTLEEAKAEWVQLGEKCAKENGATDEDLANLHKHEVPESKNAKCMLSCMLKDAGLIKDGKYTVEGSIESIKDIFDEGSPEFEKYQTIAKSCEEEVGETDDECELAAKIMACKRHFLIEMNL